MANEFRMSPCMPRDLTEKQIDEVMRAVREGAHVAFNEGMLLAVEMDRVRRAIGRNSPSTDAL